MNSNLVTELLTKVLCDVSSPSSTDGAYLYAQTIDNQQSVFATAKSLIKCDATKCALIPDSEPRCGYPGFDLWQVELQSAGISTDCIRSVPTGDFDSLNTYTEALAAVRFAKSHGFNSMHVIAAPFHQLRAFISSVSAALAEYPELRIFNAVGAALPWYQEVSHSQGSLKGVREEFIFTELDRIEKYTIKGDLLPMLRIVEYMKWRDRVA